MKGGVHEHSETGRLQSDAFRVRSDYGAAVMAAEYLSTRYPDATGFSLRNLRRMRLFCQTYADAPEVLQQAMESGWTQNVAILEAELTVSEKAWYIQAVR